jgi:hypothetical protein
MEKDFKRPSYNLPKLPQGVFVVELEATFASVSDSGFAKEENGIFWENSAAKRKRDETLVGFGRKKKDLEEKVELLQFKGTKEADISDWAVEAVDYGRPNWKLFSFDPDDSVGIGLEKEEEKEMSADYLRFEGGKHTQGVIIPRSTASWMLSPWAGMPLSKHSIHHSRL